MRRMFVSLAACTLLSAAAYAGDPDSSGSVAEDAQPDATLTLKGGSVAAGIGYTWGNGELEYAQPRCGPSSVPAVKYSR
jgi:hypothetical protein